MEGQRIKNLKYSFERIVEVIKKLLLVFTLCATLTKYCKPLENLASSEKIILLLELDGSSIVIICGSKWKKCMRINSTKESTTFFNENLFCKMTRE